MQKGFQKMNLLKYFQQKLLMENVGSKELLGNKREEIPTRTVLHAPLPLSDKYITNYFLQTTTSRSQ